MIPIILHKLKIQPLHKNEMAAFNLLYLREIIRRIINIIIIIRIYLAV